MPTPAPTTPRCPSCHGTGKLALFTSVKACEACGGSGLSGAVVFCSTGWQFRTDAAGNPVEVVGVQTTRYTMVGGEVVKSEPVEPAAN